MHGIDKAFSFEPAEVQVEASFVFFKNRECLLPIELQKNWYGKKVYVLNEVFIRLKEWKCDVDGALERFLDDEEMYMDFLHQIAEEESVAKLGAAIEAGDAQAAFDCAHTLKGVHGNMGLTPLYLLDIEIVEPLRAGSFAGVQDHYAKLVAENDKLKDILK